jgi:hypothetical protein
MAFAAVAYQHVPPTVSSVHVLVWQDGRTPTEQSTGAVSRESDVATIACNAGDEVVVAFGRSDEAYLLDGPFVCPATPTSRRLDGIWRRTLRVRAPPESDPPADVSWIAVTRNPQDSWPRCVWRGSTAECWGTAADARGVLLFTAGGRTWWTVVADVAAVLDFQQSAWARLIVVSDADARGKVVVTLAHPVVSPERRGAVRLETAGVRGAHVVALGSGASWIYGADVPASAWIEVRAARAGPKYLPLEEVALAPASLSLWVTLDDERTLDGVTRGAQGAVAAGALVTIFRLIDPLATRSDSRDKPRRVLAAERVADASGQFHFDGLGDADYEIVAWHPQLGRGIAAVGRGDTSINVRLDSAGQVRGRVMSGSKPVAGVDVISLPDPQAYAQAADLTDVKGGDGRTGVDGRFVVSLAPGGGGEVRVGGGSHPIRRFPLPRAPMSVVDLGDIDLGAAIDVSIALDRDSDCDIRATGPIGRSGLQVIGGTRAGPGLFRVRFPEEGSWEVHLSCGRDERALVPSVLPITQANNGKEVRLLVR